METQTRTTSLHKEAVSQYAKKLGLKEYKSTRYYDIEYKNGDTTTYYKIKATEKPEDYHGAISGSNWKRAKELKNDNNEYEFVIAYRNPQDETFEFVKKSFKEMKKCLTNIKIVTDFQFNVKENTPSGNTNIIQNLDEYLK